MCLGEGVSCSRVLDLMHRTDVDTLVITVFTQSGWDAVCTMQCIQHLEINRARCLNRILGDAVPFQLATACIAPTLTNLDMSFNPVSRELMRALGQCTHLKLLRLKGNQQQLP